MGLNLIKGRFFIKGYSPDGDSIRFRADNKTHWGLLGPGPLVINDKDDVQLRFEGIGHAERNDRRRYCGGAGGVGLYAQDKTVSGVNITSTVVITDQEPLFPRLFRRLADFLEGNPVNLSGFKAFLEMQDTRVVVLSPANETGFDNLVDVLGSVVKLLQPPENLLFLE